MEIIITVTGFILILIIIIFLFPRIKTHFDKKNIENKSYYNNVEIRESKFGGAERRGNFAKKDFIKGDVIELCPYIEDEKDNIVGLLKNYVFCNDNKPSKRYYGFGLCPLYNFSNKNNAEYLIDDYHNLIIIKAINNIKKDEEIFLPFSKDYKKID